MADSLRIVAVAALPGALLGAVVAARRRDFFRPDRGLLGMVGLHVVTGVLYGEAAPFSPVSLCWASTARDPRRRSGRRSRWSFTTGAR